MTWKANLISRKCQGTVKEGQGHVTNVRSLNGKNWQDLYKADKVSISFPATPKSN